MQNKICRAAFASFAAMLLWGIALPANAGPEESGIIQMGVITSL